MRVESILEIEIVRLLSAFSPINPKLKSKLGSQYLPNSLPTSGHFHML